MFHRLNPLRFFGNRQSDSKKEVEKNQSEKEVDLLDFPDHITWSRESQNPEFIALENQWLDLLKDPDMRIKIKSGTEKLSIVNNSQLARSVYFNNVKANKIFDAESIKDEGAVKRYLLNFVKDCKNVGPHANEVVDYILKNGGHSMSTFLMHFLTEKYPHHHIPKAVTVINWTNYRYSQLQCKVIIKIPYLLLKDDQGAVLDTVLYYENKGWKQMLREDAINEAAQAGVDAKFLTIINPIDLMIQKGPRKEIVIQQQTESIKFTIFNQQEFDQYINPKNSNQDDQGMDISHTPPRDSDNLPGPTR